MDVRKGESEQSQSGALEESIVEEESGLHEILNDPSAEQEPLSGLFIVGAARSGTTILWDCLNLSPDVYLLYEADLYAHHKEIPFAEYYEGQRKLLARHFGKGTFVPPADDRAEDAFQALRRLARNHKFVGDKTVFSPANSLRTDEFMWFQARHFYHSTYILMLRDPVETSWSMVKLGQPWDASASLLAWLRTLRLLIDIFRGFSKARMVFWDEASDESVIRLAKVLDITLDLPRGTIQSVNRKSALQLDEIPDGLKVSARYFEMARDLYASFREAFSSETFRYSGKECFPLFFHRVWQEAWELELLVDAFRSGGDLGARALKVRELMKAENVDEAVSALQAMLGAAELRKESEHWILFMLGKLAIGQGRIDAGEALLRDAVNLQPSKRGAQFHWRRALASQAQSAVDSGRFLEAIEKLEILLESSPRHAQWNYLLGLCLHRSGADLARALAHYDLALEGGFDEYWVRKNRGRLLLEVGENEMGRADIQRAIAIQPPSDNDPNLPSLL